MGVFMCRPLDINTEPHRKRCTCISDRKLHDFTITSRRKKGCFFLEGGVVLEIAHTRRDFHILPTKSQYPSNSTLLQ